MGAQIMVPPPAVRAMEIVNDVMTRGRARVSSRGTSTPTTWAITRCHSATTRIMAPDGILGVQQKEDGRSAIGAVLERLEAQKPTIV